MDLEAAARDVWESGYRLADLSSQSSQEFRFQVQESLLHVLQRHIASLTPDQAQVPTPLHHRRWHPRHHRLLSCFHVPPHLYTAEATYCARRSSTPHQLLQRGTSATDFTVAVLYAGCGGS